VRHRTVALSPRMPSKRRTAIPAHILVVLVGITLLYGLAVELNRPASIGLTQRPEPPADFARGANGLRGVAARRRHLA
jgi:hypothetical protein